MKKVGIITFHNSYNCGSMLESYAMQEITKKLGFDTKIIDFYTEKQKDVYRTFYKNNSVKNIIKNILTLPAIRQIKYNNKKYEEFKNKNFNLTKHYSCMGELSDGNFDFVIAGSDQIWNITIPDSEDAYFLPWVKKAKKVAYAPSFGAKNILKYSDNSNKYKKYLESFDALSIREKNGQKWIKEMIGQDVPVLLDPTLLLTKDDYEKIATKKYEINEKYIFFYAPAFKRDICRFVKKIADKYKLKVITWSTKSYNFKLIKTFGFELPEYESPALYLYLIKHAELVLTTSYHGTIFSTIYGKKFYTIKNNEMYGSDDRVRTLLEQISMEERLIPYDFDSNYDYLTSIDYTNYNKNLINLQKKSINYLKKSLEVNINEKYK